MAQSTINPVAILAGLAAAGAGAWYFLAGPGSKGGGAGNNTERREGILFVSDTAANAVKQALSNLRVSAATVTPPGATGSAVNAVEYTLATPASGAPIAPTSGDSIVGKTGLDAARAAYNAGLMPVGSLVTLLQGKPGVLRAVTLAVARSSTSDASGNAVAPAAILL